VYSLLPPVVLPPSIRKILISHSYDLSLVGYNLILSGKPSSIPLNMPGFLLEQH